MFAWDVQNQVMTRRSFAEYPPAVAGEPAYRLTYSLERDGALRGTFAIAPPDQPQSFRQYLAWASRKAGG